MTARPVHLTLQNGQTLAFSRHGRDHLFWDWYLRGAQHAVDFTPEGEILLRHENWQLLLRPGTTDFFIFREIFLKDEYGLRSLPDKLDTVIDLGGNVGLFTCAMLPRARRVITVEPVLANYQQAARNLVRNGSSAAELLRHAVTARSGEETTIHLSARNTGMNSLFEHWVEKGGALGQEKVMSISLPDLLERTGGGMVDLLKCDIEGAEFDVFAATPRHVLRQIRRIVMEVHLGPEHPPAALTALTTQLSLAGFDLTTSKIGTRGANETWFLRGQRQPQPVYACLG